MAYTIAECMEIIGNIDTKLSDMAAVRDGLESRRDELQSRLMELLNLEMRVAELEMELENFDLMSLDEIIEMGADEWRDAVVGIRSRLEELRAELGE